MPDTRPDHGEAMRIAEALLFASAEPLSADDLAAAPAGGRRRRGRSCEISRRSMPARGVNLVRVAGRWAFRTAGDLSFVLARDVVEQRRSSPAPPWRPWPSWPITSR